MTKDQFHKLFSTVTDAIQAHIDKRFDDEVKPMIRSVVRYELAQGLSDEIEQAIRQVVRDRLTVELSISK